MKKQILLIVLALTLVLTLVPVTSVSGAVPNQYTLRNGTIGQPETVDPGWLYDTASSELVWNVYDTLLTFMVNESDTNPITKGLADHFEANLAYEWYKDETNPDHPVFYFKIRGSHDHFISVVGPYIGGDPTSTTWTENATSEQPGCPWHIWKWEDNNLDGHLSACDIVKMDKLDWMGPDVAPWLAFHVQEMHEVGGGVYSMLLKELPVPFQILRTLSLPGSLTNPVGSIVTEASPVAGRQYLINEFEDGMFHAYDGVLSAGDVIQMTRQDSAPPEYPNGWTRDYIVEEVTGTQLIVRPCLTCWDVEYTIERWFVLDHTGGPQWMIYEVLTYPEYSWPKVGGEVDLNFNATVDAAIETDCTWVWFTFAIPYSDMIFRQVMAQSWASIMYMDWAIDQGCWDGNWAHVAAYHDPEESPLMDPEPVMCGTGPYYFVEWIPAKSWRIERFEEHWQQWPARGCNGYLNVIIEEFISEWPTRKLMFLAGDLDFCYVPRQYKADVEGKPGIRDIYPLEGVTIDGIFYNFDISLKSRYLYPPFIEHLNAGQLKETGIPPDFFSDVNVRKAFSYCINYTEFQLIAYLGESVYPVTPMPDAGVFKQYRHDPSWYTANQYNLNLTKAKYYFEIAYGGGPTNPGEDPTLVTSPGLLWTTGFRLPVTYNTGNVPRRTIAEDYIKTNVEHLNAKFHVDVYDVDWGGVYIPELFSWKLPLFVIGWIPDYLDPHNYMFTFMGTYGSFSYFQSYSDPHVDDLIDWGMKNSTLSIRQAIYRELEEIYIRDNPGVCTDQPWGRHFERTWMYGWYYDPIYPGGYFKHYWKDTPPGVVTVQPVDMSVLHSISNVTQAIITAHTNPPLINDQKPYLKIVIGPAKGSRPRIIVSVHWDRADSNNLISAFYSVIGVKIQRGTTEHVEWVETFAVGGPGDSGTRDCIIDLSTLTAKAYAGGWKFSAEIGVADETAYDSVPANNTILDNWGIVLGTGDVYWKDLLGLVDISDLVSMVAAVGSMPGDANWNWYADIYQATTIDNKVDISDLTALVSLVGVTDYVDPLPPP
jgi:peptide/nickel transport system substrate-binding protein